MRHCSRENEVGVSGARHCDSILTENMLRAPKFSIQPPEMNLAPEPRPPAGQRGGAKESLTVTKIKQRRTVILFTFQYQCGAVENLNRLASFREPSENSQNIVKEKKGRHTISLAHVREALDTQFVAKCR